MSHWDRPSFLDALVGRTVLGIDVSAGEEHLRFRCNGGVAIVWETEGDCCSETWWADGYSLNALRGGMVRAATAISLPDYNVEDGRTRQEEDEAYGVEITTDKGVARFAYRNSSNGYYGGEALLGADSDDVEWREITGNEWSA